MTNLELTTHGLFSSQPSRDQNFVERKEWCTLLPFLFSLSSILSLSFFLCFSPFPLSLGPSLPFFRREVFDLRNTAAFTLSPLAQLLFYLFRISRWGMIRGGRTIPGMNEGAVVCSASKGSRVTGTREEARRQRVESSKSGREGGKRGSRLERMLERDSCALGRRASCLGLVFPSAGPRWASLHR